MKSTNIRENIRKIRKDHNVSLHEFANRLNDNIGEDIYSKDMIYRLEKGMAKIPAEFVMHVSNTFEISLDAICFGEKIFSQEELENNPEHGITSEKYRHFLAYAKNLSSEMEKPITKEMLVKFEQAIEDMETVLNNNVKIRAKLDYCTYFIKTFIQTSPQTNK